MIFLMHYDRSRGELLSMHAFTNDQRALADETRLRMELEEHAQGIMREIVTLEAPTEAHIRRTHRRYFETIEQLVKLAS